MIPGNGFSTTAQYSAFLSPDDRVRTSLLVDYEMGGVAIGDPSQGLQVQVWEARVNAGTIEARPESGGAWTPVTSDAGITEIALAFDQNMRPAVAYLASGVAKFYWYDSVAAAYVTTTYAGATSPVVTMDDKRPLQVGLNDVLLFYLRDGRVRHRLQRDRFAVEYDMAATPVGATRITRWGFNEGRRVQLEFGNDPAATPPSVGYGCFYVDMVQDLMYVVDGTTVLPFLTTGRRTGLWRSGKLIRPTHESFAWLQVNGPGSLSVTVRVYCDGALVNQLSVTSRNPVRLKAMRGRIWEIEAEGQGNITQIRMAASVEELQG